MTPSMHRRASATVGGPGHTVALVAKLSEQVHYRGLARVHKGPTRDVLGVVQQFFGLGHVVRIGLSVRKIFARAHAVTHVVTR